MIKKAHLILTLVVITFIYLSSCNSKDKVLHMATKPLSCSICALVGPPMINSKLKSAR